MSIFSYFFGKSKKTNAQAISSIVGEKCIVVEKIDNFAGCGEVKVKGKIWAARAVMDEDVFEIGERLSIVAIEGVKLICSKKQS